MGELVLVPGSEGIADMEPCCGRKLQQTVSVGNACFPGGIKCPVAGRNINIAAVIRCRTATTHPNSAKFAIGCGVENADLGQGLRVKRKKPTVIWTDVAVRCPRGIQDAVAQ